MVIYLNKQRRAHPGITLTDTQKDNSLRAAQLMFHKHSTLEDAKRLPAIAVRSGTPPPQKKINYVTNKNSGMKYVVMNSKPTLAKVPSTPHSTGIDAKKAAMQAQQKISENQEAVSQTKNSKYTSQLNSTRAATLAQSWSDEQERETQNSSKPQSPTMNSKKAAALAHINLADMETEWDLPLNKQLPALFTQEPDKNPYYNTSKKVSNHSYRSSDENLSILSSSKNPDNKLRGTVTRASKDKFYLTVPTSALKLNENQYSNNSGAEMGDNESINSNTNEIMSIMSSSSIINQRRSPSPDFNKNALNMEEQDYNPSVYSSNSNMKSLLKNNSIYSLVPISTSSKAPKLINNCATNTYGAINKRSGGNVKYEGTLPDLIPNHLRQHSKVEKLKNKFFKSHEGYNTAHSTTDLRKSMSVTSFDSNLHVPSYLSLNNIVEDPTGKEIIRTNQNTKLKTTMRRDNESDNENVNRNGVYGNPNKNKSFDEFGNPINPTMHDYDFDSSDEFSEYDNASGSDNNDKIYKKKMKRRERLKSKFKKTTAVIPYGHHHSNSSHHYLSHITNNDTSTGNNHFKGFNEDKPWKSHNDSYYITEQERKRYEGMWVSNRFLYLELLPWWGYLTGNETEQSTIGSNPILAKLKFNIKGLPDDGLMLNLVAQDIWLRSCLPNDILMNIYDLVDLRNDGTLDRKSFIVGMWLIDQCLYGRKLPKSIDQTIWDSIDKYMVNALTSGSTIKAIKKNKKKLIKKEIKYIKKEMKSIHI
ncbi:hypothetical protein TPHA_0I01000 [Tetrapisispora phaffii CBS 4417]|uniref:EH domain-containing protein n=1 Tax=Tetrapisispora phaffii (strain ATCC 24235 / CBS 4417 / NBRC 1672 / NRRL Y-8282 / UCD 70-5) TaxID=1071381 RepID=G8BXH8_TETPH|nr:hypothetical protein TPHA_0I01000 [Tetrapisispora phaffii CBS 4417]CCE64606.1 hypothetical protein TPHA_0I01000 [Tetrapisispora phaffii CBS 4417]